MTEGLKEKILELRKNGKTYNEIIDEIKCSKSVVSYHCKKAGLENIGFTIETINDKKIKEIKKYYLTHTLKETGEFFKVSRATVIKYTDNKRILLCNEDKKQRRIDSVVNRRRKIKQLAIEYKGGSCVKCRYNKYYGALEFHHLDPNEKDFSISKSGHCTSWEKVKIELDKCILVCANCHREIHEEERKNKESLL